MGRRQTHNNFFFGKIVYYFFFIYVYKKMYFVSFQDFSNQIMLALSTLTVRHLNICIIRKNFLDENQKTKFSSMKKLQEATKI